jgi:hypothetical protein
VGPRTGLDVTEKRTFLPLPGLELQPLCRPARSQSLYRLRYPGSLAACRPMYICRSLVEENLQALFLDVDSGMHVRSGEKYGKKLQGSDCCCAARDGGKEDYALWLRPSCNTYTPHSPYLS